jgi:hypothetical protein
VTEELDETSEFDLSDEDEPQGGTPEPDADLEKVGRRRRKRRRNRRADVALVEPAEPEARPFDLGPPSSLPAGPPRIPTFQKGAHGRRRD